MEGMDGLVRKFPPVDFTIKRDEMGVMSITGTMPDDRVTAIGILEVAIDQIKKHFDKRDALATADAAEVARLMGGRHGRV